MDDGRRNPEELLARVTESESSRKRGKLKVFLGAAAGVGKTYRMLEAGKELMDDGADVVAGLVVTHGRKETEALLHSFELVPPQIITYRQAQFAELDLDATLARRPALVLVDELAHTNVPGCRHEKRWQDVEELLEAGISVDTTVNIQHLESANDVVTQITGVRVHETVPDSVFELADEIEVVDLPPDMLIQRLKEGKVYVPEKIDIALEHFFRKGNLIALRELALRSTAQRVDRQMQQYRTEVSAGKVWAATERLLVCVGPGPHAVKTIRAGKRMATALNADWLAVYVETPRSVHFSPKVRENIARAMRLAEQLGAQIVVLTGLKITDEIMDIARSRNVSKIVIGKPVKPRWMEILFGSVADQLIRASSEVDVYVITNEGEAPGTQQQPRPPAPSVYVQYATALGWVVGATIVNQWLFKHLQLANLVMIYQLVVVIVTMRSGIGPAIFSSIASVVACAYFFVPPYLTIAPKDPQYLITLVVMLVAAFGLSTFTYTIKHQAESARRRERQTAARYAMTREQSVSIHKEEVLNTTAKHIKDVFDSRIAVFLSNEDGKLVTVSGIEGAFDVDSHELAVAQWVFNNGQQAGAATNTLPGAKALYLPLSGSAGPLGVIGIMPSEPKRFLRPEDMHLLKMLVNQTALAVERALLTAQAGE